MLALHELYMLLTLVHTVSDGCSVDSETSEDLALWYCFRGLWKLSLRMCWSIRPTWLADQNVRYMIYCSLFGLVNVKMKSPRLHLSEVHIYIYIYVWFTLCQMAAQWTPKHLRIWPCVLQGPVETLTANVLINTTNLIGGSKCQIYDILFSFWTCQCQNEITTATSKRGSFTLYY